MKKHVLYGYKKNKNIMFWYVLVTNKWKSAIWWLLYIFQVEKEVLKLLGEQTNVAQNPAWKRGIDTESSFGPEKLHNHASLGTSTGKAGIDNFSSLHKR